MQVLDYSAGRPAAEAVAAAGYAGAVRYLAWLPNPKVLTIAEAVDFWAAGLALAVVWEQGADPTAEDPGAVGPHVDRQMRAEGFPDGWGFFVAADFDVPRSRWAQIAGWGDACSRAAGRPWRLYGRTALGEQLVADGHMPSYWDPYAWSGEDGYTLGVPGPHACLFQRLGEVTVGGVACDVNDVRMPDWLGFSPAPISPPPAPPTPDPIPTGDAVTLEPLTIDTDPNGNGDAPCDGRAGRPAVPWGRCVAVTPNGVDPEAAHAYSPIARLSMSDYLGLTKIELEGGPPSASVLVWLAVAG